MFKFDLLEKIFLVVTVMDVIVLSIVAMFIVSLVVIGVFLGIIMIGAGTFILLFETIKNTITMNIFTGMGFLGMGILYFIIEIILLLIFKKLIKTYPGIINWVKKFIFLQDEKETKKNEQKKESKKVDKSRDNIIVVFFIIAIVLSVISIITQNFGTVIEFMENGFKWG